MKLLAIFAGCFLFLVAGAYAEEMCMSVEDGKKLVVELEQKRVLEQMVVQYEAVLAVMQKQIQMLEKENELLKEQVDLLKQEVEIMKDQANLLKEVVEEQRQEISRLRRSSFFSQLKVLGFGILVGVALLGAL